MRHEMILRIMKFSADAENEIKFVPSYAAGKFHICKANIS